MQPIYPTFLLEENAVWVTYAMMPSWRGYRARRVPYGTELPKGPSDGTTRIMYAPEGRDTAPLEPAEIAVVDWVVTQEAALAQAVLEALLAHYPTLQEDFGYEDDEKQEMMPDVTTIEGFLPLIWLNTMYVHQLSKDGVPYIGFSFGCTWDDEHGLGILMHGTRMVEIGGADTSFLLWIAERDAEQS